MSVIDYPRKKLDPNVWDEDRFSPKKRAFILGMIKKYFPSATQVIVLGSITTHQYTSTSDIDVHVFFPQGENIDAMHDIVKVLNRENIYLPETKHPLQFFVLDQNAPQQVNRAIGAYDLVRDKWIKRTDDLSVDLKQFDQSFHEKIRRIDLGLAELNRDVKDIKYLIEAFQEVPKEEQQKILEQLQLKKQEIDDDLKALADQHNEIAMERVIAFQQSYEEDPNVAHKYLRGHTLPGNIIFKLMEHYGYHNLLGKLSRIYHHMHS